MELLTIQSSLPTPTLIINSSSSLPNHFNLLAQRWKLNIRKIPWNGHRILVHVLKEIEETCISKLEDAVPIYETVDDNHIPSGFAQVCQFEGNRVHKTSTSLGIDGRDRQCVLTPCRLPLAKTTASFLLLVPLLAFCIMTALQAKNKRRHRPAKKSQSQGHSNSNSMRWKTVLTDLRDPEPEPGLLMEEDKEHLYFEDMPNNSRKLEDEYQKFLSDCGMSKWGYWRGGSGSTSAD